MNGPNNHTRILIALVFIALYGVHTFLPWWVPMPKDPALGQMISSTTKNLENLVMLVAGFYLGSSAGSAMKDMAISNMMTQPPALPPVKPMPDLDIPDPPAK